MELKQVDKSGKMRRAKKEKKAAEAKPAAPGELGDWAIRVPPTPELKAVLADKQAAAVEEIRRHQKAIDDSAEAHSALKKKRQKEIQDVEERQDKLVTETRYGTTAKRRCYRRREGDEWVYLGLEPPHGELWREPAADGQQQRLVGKETAPKSSDLDRLLEKARNLGTWVALPSGKILELTAPARERAQIYIWPAGELSWHPRVRWCQERLLGTNEVRQSGDEHAGYEPPAERKSLKWGKVPGELTWHTKGSRVHQYRIDLTDGTDVVITAGAPSNPGQHVELTRYKLPPEPNVTAEVKLAKGWCQEHLDSRLEWPGDPASGVLLDSTGRYQLSRYMVAGPAGEMWRTQHLPGQDQPAIDLGDHRLPAAQAACQAHADERRAG